MKQAHSDRKVIADNVRAEMGRRRIMQSEVANWLGIKQPAVSAKLAAKVPFDVDELGVIAEHMGIPLYALTVLEPAYAAPFPGGLADRATGFRTGSR